MTFEYGSCYNQSMVRLINDKNIGLVCDIAYSILRIQERFTRLKEWNNPKLSPCIYAMWHANQFMVHGIENKSSVNILISNSIDGEIVTRVAENWGFKVVRGSSGKKGSVESTMQMISRINAGESVAIMVDGPHGPLHRVKDGVVKLAQKTGVPIVPAYWYSPQKNFINLPSWDNMKVPFGLCYILNIYGNPIYVKSDATDSELTLVKEEIKKQLLDLENNAPQIFQEAKEKNLWKR